MNSKIIIALLLMFVGVFANMPDCGNPVYDGFNGWYNYMDGLNSTWDPSSETSFEINSADIGVPELALLDADSMTFIEGVRWMDGSDNRGAGWLFWDGSVSRYYAVFQYNAQIYAVPNLQIQTSGNSTYYDADNETVWSYRGNDSLTMVKLMNTTDVHANGANIFSNTADVLKYGNSTFYNYVTDNIVYHEQQTTAQGSIDIHPPGVQASGNGAAARMSNASRFNVAGLRTLATAGIGATGTFYGAIDYYSCPSLSGTVTFTAYEGSESCPFMGSAPNLNCFINTDTVAVTGSYSNETNTTVNVPRFKNTVRVGDYLKIEPLIQYPDTWLSDPHTLLEFRKYDEHEAALTLYPITVGSEQLYDRATAAVIEYIPPNDNIDSFELADLTFNTTLDISASCGSGLLGQDSYNMTLIVGFNQTFFKKSEWNCTGGTATTSVTYSSDLNSLIPASYRAPVTLMKIVYLNADLPLWKSTSTNTLNRFFFFNLEFGDTWAKYVGEIAARDNENYALTFTERNFTIVETESNSYPYDTYLYQCIPPSGYEFVSGTGTAFVTINEPREYVDVIMQNTTVVGLNITVRQQRGLLQQAQCNIGGQYVSSGTDGVCSFNGLSTETNYTVYVTKGLLRRSATFAIGDHYASPTSANECGFGNTGQCSVFLDNDRYYEYEWDIENAQALMRVKPSVNRLGESYKVVDVNVYWDDESQGITGSDGVLDFLVDHEYGYPHALFLNKTGFYDVSVSACIEEVGYFPVMVERANSTYGDDQAGQTPLSITETASIFGKPLFMGSMIVVLGMVSGAAYAGLAGALSLGVAASVLMSLQESSAGVPMFPWSITLIIVFIAVVFGAMIWKDRIGGVN